MGSKSKILLIILPVFFVGFTVFAVIAMKAVRSHRYVEARGNSSYAVEFADMQSKHIKAAKRLGFSTAPLKDEKSVQGTDGLVKVKSCKYFKVSEMKHASPYLTPVASNRLYQISKEFNETCRAKGLPSARLIVTSMLRTKDDVEELRKSNKNAVKDSSHMYGTTFDISWSYYQCPRKRVDGEAYLEVLAEVLRKNRMEGAVFVRYETAQRCFHITVNK